MENLLDLRKSKWTRKWAHLPGLIPLLEKILYFPTINELYHSRPQTTHLPALLDYLFNFLDVELIYDKKDLSLIPAKGPVIVVANHPFGGIEGVALASLFLQIRLDVKILANYLLKYITPYSDLFIGINPFETKKISAMNINGLKEAQKWLADGGLLCAFPSGVVSHWQLKTQAISDPEWHKTIARLAELESAMVIPVYFQGRNSWYFQLAGMISPHLRTLLLPQQFFAKKHSALNIAIGKAIDSATLNKKGNANQQIEYLRERTYLLEYRLNQGSFRKNSRESVVPISQAVPTELQISDISRLPPSASLLEHEDLIVYIASAEIIPHILPEIGRLREATFRLAGIGTGKASDLDNFDQYYLHLFTWHKKENKIIGAYRLGLTDQINHKELYISTLFKLSQQFFAQIKPGIELGRAFVIPEYQKKPLPLFLLWKAILKFAVRNPQYTSIYGVVSISPLYQKLSRDLLVYFLHHHHWNSALAPLIQGQNPYPIPKSLPKLLQKMLGSCNGFQDLDCILSEIEHDRKGIPILLKQYKNMQAKVVGFNHDQQFDYVDCLFLVYIQEMPHKKLSYYMGKKDLETYLSFRARNSA